MSQDGGPDPAAEPCAWCPVCATMRTVQRTHPDVALHLAGAARELALALAAAFEAYAEGGGDEPPSGGTTLRRVTVE